MLRESGSGRQEDWAHFSEMAQTWEKLADMHELAHKLKSSGVLLTKAAVRAERSVGWRRKRKAQAIA
jgi:hypothetical protein